MTRMNDNDLGRKKPSELSLLKNQRQPIGRIHQKNLPMFRVSQPVGRDQEVAQTAVIRVCGVATDKAARLLPIARRKEGRIGHHQVHHPIWHPHATVCLLDTDMRIDVSGVATRHGRHFLLQIQQPQLTGVGGASDRQTEDAAPASEVGD